MEKLRKKSRDGRKKSKNYKEWKKVKKPYKEKNNHSTFRKTQISEIPNTVHGHQVTAIYCNTTTEICATMELSLEAISADPKSLLSQPVRVVRHRLSSWISDTRPRSWNSSIRDYVSVIEEWWCPSVTKVPRWDGHFWIYLQFSE